METIEVESFDEDTILKNRSSGIVSIYGKYFDQGSGVKTVTVTEQRIRDKSGDEVHDESIKSKTYNAKSENAVFVDKGDGNTEFCIKYETQSKDGAILITVSVADACTNTDSNQDKTVVVIKDTGLKPEELRLENLSSNITHFSVDLEEYYLAAGEYSSYVSTYSRAFGVIYKDVQRCYDPQKMHVYVEYALNGTNKRVEISLGERTVELYHPMDYDCEDPYYGEIQILTADLSDFNDETFAGKTIRIIVQDELGNSNYTDYTIPKKPIFSYAEWYSEDPYRDYYHVYYSQNAPDDSLWIGDFSGFTKKNSLCFSKEGGVTYYAQFQCSGGFYGPKSESFTTIPDDSSLPAIEGAVVGYANKPNSEETYVTVTIPQDSWSKYSSVYYFLRNERVDFVTGSFSASFPLRTSYLYSNSYDISLYGEKSNGQRTKGKILPTTKLSGVEYDNCKPELSHFSSNRYADYHQAILKYSNILEGFDSIIAYEVQDYGSGLDYITLKTSDMEKGYRYDASDYLKLNFIAGNANHDLLLIPVWDMDDDVKLNFNGAQDSSDSKQHYFPITQSNMVLSAYDKAGNHIERDTSFSFHYITKPEIFSITENNEDSSITYKIMFSHTYDHSKMYRYIYKLVYNGTDEKYIWQLVSGTDSGNDATWFSYQQFNISVNTIYKVIAQEDIYLGGGNTDDTKDDYGTSEPLYICIGDDQDNDFESSGNYDYILPIEGSNNSVLVASDATTFVHTLVTKKSYEECKDWDIETWEHHRKHIGDYQFNFSSTNYNAQRYRIPVGEIHDDECYVVVAHFANGETARSKVFQK